MAKVASPMMMMDNPDAFKKTRKGIDEKEEESEEEDLYVRYKTLQRELEFIQIQEEYVRDEQKNLKIELMRAQEEVKRIQSVPLVIGQFLEMVDENSGIVSSTTGSNYYVRILSTLNRELLKPSSSGFAQTLERVGGDFTARGGFEHLVDERRGETGRDVRGYRRRGRAKARDERGGGAAVDAI